MTAELVRGENHPLPHTRLEIQVSAGRPLAAAVLLADAGGRVPGADRVALPGRPQPVGVAAPGRPATSQRLTVDLAALPAGVERLYLALVLPAGAGAFGATAAPHTVVAAPDGTETATFTLAGLTVETAVVALEFYRRAGAWKVRAIGQGYAAGAEALLRDHGVPEAAALASLLTADPAPAGTDRAEPRTPRAAEAGTVLLTPVAAAVAAAEPDTGAAAHRPVDPRVAAALGPPDSGPRPAPAPPAAPPVPPTPPAPPAPPAAPSGPPAPVAGDAPGRSMDERLYNQVWGVFEDTARSTAAYRSAVEYADSRQESELEALLTDPATRVGPAAERARRLVRARRDDLEQRAREVLERDGGQLLAEALVVEEALPAAMARWESPAWADWQPPEEPPYAVRLGDLHLPEHPALRIPMLVRLPLARGLWVDSGASPDYGTPDADRPTDREELRAAAAAVAAALAARLLACHRPGDLLLHAVDPGGTAGGALAPFVRAGLLAGPPASDLAAVTALLDALVGRVDLVQMALSGGAADALPPYVDPADRLLLVHDFPYGFDERTVGRLRYLAEEGPAVGVHLLLVADRADAREYRPALASFWRGLTRLAPLPQDYLADPWVEHLWTYSPLLPAPGDRVLPDLLHRLG
ncbi:TerD family protein [Streptomyces sp. NPDC092296]|uniref:TerD family protein n=1 Tax=Streptomyces sp. NPDC092296 TaxID=3366012 RepID=UPI0038025EB4